MSYSRKNPNRMIWGHTFLKKKHDIFGFITLPLEILDKAKFYANSVKLCFTLWKFQGQKWRLMEIQHFFWSILEIPLLYQSAPRISTWYFLNIPEKFSYIYDIYMQIYMQYICYMNIIIDIIFNTIFDFGSVCIMEINLSLRGDLNCILL